MSIFVLLVTICFSGVYVPVLILFNMSDPYACVAFALTTNSPGELGVNMLSLVDVPGPVINPPCAFPSPINLLTATPASVAPAADIVAINDGPIAAAIGAPTPVAANAVTNAVPNTPPNTPPRMGAIVIKIAFFHPPPSNSVVIPPISPAAAPIPPPSLAPLGMADTAAGDGVNGVGRGGTTPPPAPPPFQPPDVVAPAQPT